MKHEAPAGKDAVDLNRQDAVAQAAEDAKRLPAQVAASQEAAATAEKAAAAAKLGVLKYAPPVKSMAAPSAAHIHSAQDCMSHSGLPS